MSRINRKERQKRRAEFQEQAGQAYDRMMGEDGQNGLVTFEEREDRACELGDALTRRLLEEHLSLDDAVDPGPSVPCPICGKPVRCDAPEKVELQSRSVRTRRGMVELERAARRCSRCRRIFFPR